MPMLSQPYTSLETSLIWDDCGENVGNASISSYIFSGNFLFRSIWGNTSGVDALLLVATVKPPPSGSEWFHRATLGIWLTGEGPRKFHCVSGRGAVVVVM